MVEESLDMAVILDLLQYGDHKFGVLVLTQDLD